MQAANTMHGGVTMKKSIKTKYSGQNKKCIMDGVGKMLYFRF